MIYESDVCGAMLGGENRSRLVPLASVLGQEGLAEEGKHRGDGGTVLSNPAGWDIFNEPFFIRKC